MNLSKQQRAELRMKFGGKCAYCGCELPEKGWHADHVEPVRREWWNKKPKVRYRVNPDKGNIEQYEERIPVKMKAPEHDSLDNLFPSCRSCNLDKHSMTLETWRISIKNKVDVCRYQSAFRHAERFGLIQEIDKPVVFYFETLTSVAAR